MKYGILTYRESFNLGDEIQTVAARQFLPRLDFSVDREALSSFSIDGPATIILNGWYMHHPETWPPPANFRPLLTSMHISRWASSTNLGRTTPERLLTGARGEYFRRWGPVGGRDWHTVALLQRHDIPAYWSGCLTLTLTIKPEPSPREDVLLSVDLDEAMDAHLQARSRTPVRRLTHDFPSPDPNAKFARAHDLLMQYARAKVVVTTRLHCALPCLALGTPVLFIEAATDRYRFDGLRDLMHHTVPEDFLADRYDYSFETPPPNLDYYLALRRTLIESVSKFIQAAGAAN